MISTNIKFLIKKSLSLKTRNAIAAFRSKEVMIFILGALLIVLCGWIDSQYFKESTAGKHISFFTRSVFHLLSFVLIGLIGQFVWKSQAIKWPAKLWTVIYLAGTIIILGSAFLYFIDYQKWRPVIIWASQLRTFFCSLIPYFTFYFIFRICKDYKPLNSN
jgi:hypothetical protein